MPMIVCLSCTLFHLCAIIILVSTFFTPYSKIQETVNGVANFESGDLSKAITVVQA